VIGNPLVAAAADAPKDAWAGVWIAEDIQLIQQGVKNGSWIDATLGTVGASLDALALVVDPAGTLVQYGIAWLIEHVKPLSDALDWLAGDPAQITAHAHTWRNIAQSLQQSTHNLNPDQGTPEWHGTAAEAYRAWATEQRHAIAGIATAADTMATITEATASLIAAVRIMVRDAIATVVSRVAVYAVELIASLGAATPLVVEQVTALVATWAARIARWLKTLLASLRHLMPIIRRLGELIDELKKILNRLRGGTPHNPSEPPSRLPSKYDGVSDADLIANRGAHLGRPGSGPKVREVASEADLKEYFDALTRNGSTDITPPGFPGRMVQLPDGTIVNWRTQSKTTGSVPTIDVNPGNGQNFKVHVNPNDW
jgi:hypothetical protein